MYTCKLYNMVNFHHLQFLVLYQHIQGYLFYKRQDKAIQHGFQNVVLLLGSHGQEPIINMCASSTS